MKIFIYLFIVIASLFLTSSCNDDELPASDTTSVKLNFLATFDGEPLLFNQDGFSTNYQYDGKDIFFQRFSFYVSDIVLLESGSEDEAELSEIEFLDFTENSSLSEAMSPQELNFVNVPVGEYKGLKLSLGVPADLNDQKPGADYTGDHPLAMTGHYWEDWDSYIFMKINGLYDYSENGITGITTDSDDIGFSFHTGSDAAYRTPSAMLKNFSLSKNGTQEFTIEIDMKQIIENVDFGTDPNIHTGNINDLTLANQVMDNFQGALTLKD